jgi:hypothetical protein
MTNRLNTPFLSLAGALVLTVATSAQVPVQISAQVPVQISMKKPPAPPPPPWQQIQKSQEGTLTGCLVEARTPGMFLLQDAVFNVGEKPQTYRLATASDYVDFVSKTERKVQMFGTAEVKAPPAGGWREEKDYPLFIAKTVVDLTDVCTGRR